MAFDAKQTKHLLLTDIDFLTTVVVYNNWAAVRANLVAAGETAETPAEAQDLLLHLFNTGQTELYLQLLNVPWISENADAATNQAVSELEAQAPAQQRAVGLLIAAGIGLVSTIVSVSAKPDTSGSPSSTINAFNAQYGAHGEYKPNYLLIAGIAIGAIALIVFLWWWWFKR